MADMMDFSNRELATGHPLGGVFKDRGGCSASGIGEDRCEVPQCRIRILGSYTLGIHGNSSDTSLINTNLYERLGSQRVRRSSSAIRTALSLRCEATLRYTCR